ncbi:phosphomannomutase/phosphoglucomutase [Acinetobacter shaoyimingii]|uniref:phosphomannomutase n=1 Tax=Acinetobacter shaoyimingii TaxID=2715164 RepID=A0A6G8RTH5_9GAMM|nr:phosphomannomutase/phosphoglucomutase [Acinetobacter shaoyimingii]QIO05214.1 phosphomannomutase/phosphoglucomutase [Acinetobacter shaoyimingii]
MNTNLNLFPKQIFRAYDIRGKVNLLTPQVVFAIGHGLVAQYQNNQQKKIVIGYDARLSSPFYAKIIATIFKEHHFDVTEVGCCSTPQLNFAARNTQGNGIMVTASHNPKEDNGIKWIMQFEPPSPDMIQSVAGSAEPYFYTNKRFSIENDVKHQIKSEYCLAYQAELLSDIELQRPLKVVIDGLNGSAGYCADLILQKMGCEVISLRTNPDGDFPDHAPDPSLSIHLKKLQEKVLLHEADLGIALDGDGDRVVLVDENAKIITADRLLSLFAQICLATHPEHEIVFDVKCSSMVKNTVERLGGHPKMIRTGSSFLRRYIAQSEGQAVFGGEYAGHYVFNDGRGHGYDDGIYAALRVMEYLSQQPHTTLSDLLAQYPERCGTEDTYISTGGIDPQLVLGQVEGQCQSLGASIQKIDGIRLDFKDGFGIMRASNTGDFFTVRFDADSPTGLNDIRHKFVSMLSDAYPNIAHDILNAQ